MEDHICHTLIVCMVETRANTSLVQDLIQTMDTLTRKLCGCVWSCCPNLLEYLLMHSNPERTGFIFAAKSGPLRVSGWLLVSPGLFFFVLKFKKKTHQRQDPTGNWQKVWDLKWFQWLYTNQPLLICSGVASQTPEVCLQQVLARPYNHHPRSARRKSGFSLCLVLFFLDVYPLSFPEVELILIWIDFWEVSMGTGVCWFEIIEIILGFANPWNIPQHSSTHL